MSRERNVQTLRALLELWNGADRSVTREVQERIDRDFEIQGPLSSITGKPYRGVEGVGQWLSDIDDQFTVWEVREPEIRALSDDRFVVLSSIHARGRESGVELDWPAGARIDFSEGRLLRLTIYPSHDEALQAPEPEQ
jgi:hypothetical protein